MNPIIPIVRFCFLALVLPPLSGCGAGSARNPDINDGNNGGSARDPDNNDGNGGSRSVLRTTIGINLAEVGSFVALSGPSGSGKALRARLSALESSPSALEPEVTPGPKLLAVKLSGEVLEVSLVENRNPGTGDVITQPAVTAIYPTASWILFAVPGFGLDSHNGPIPCNLIAARRLDGAL